MGGLLGLGREMGRRLRGARLGEDVKKEVGGRGAQSSRFPSLWAHDESFSFGEEEELERSWGVVSLQKS